MKPRFPLSVTRTFCYRAFLKDSGEMLECNDFKSLYRITKSHLRDEVGSACSDYHYSTAVLSFGYATLYEIKPGYYYEEWAELHRFGCFYVSTLTESFMRFRDGKDVVNKRGVYSNDNRKA